MSVKPLTDLVAESTPSALGVSLNASALLQRHFQRAATESLLRHAWASSLRRRELHCRHREEHLESSTHIARPPREWVVHPSWLNRGLAA